MKTNPKHYHMSEKLNQRLSENIAMVALENNYEQIEDTAMHVLTDIMKDVAL